MRSTLALMLALSVAAAPAMAEPPNIRIDVPDNAKGLEVNVREREIAPGEIVDWHIHPGVEIAYVVSGTVEAQVAGEATRQLVKGDTFQAGRGIPHRAANRGKEPAVLLITYLKDKAGPSAVKVPPPGAD